MIPEGSTPSSSLATRALGLVLIAWLGVVLGVNLPGHLSVDSLTQIAEGRTGVFESWNPLFISLIFGKLVAWTGGTEIIVVMSSLLLYGSLKTLLKAPDLWGLLGLLVVALLLSGPVLLVYPGIVWKDVWFAHLTMAAFAMIALRSTGWPWWTEAIALLLLAAATLTRQTAIIPASTALVALTVAANNRAAAPERTWAVRVKALGLRALVMLTMAALLSFGAKTMSRSISGQPVGTGVRLVAIFDIAGILQRQPGQTLSHLRGQGFDTEAFEAGARRTFSAERIDTLDLPPMTGPTALTLGDIMRQWLELALQHPGSYLAHRCSVYLWFAGLEDQSRCLPIHVGVETGPLTERAGLQPLSSRWSSQLYAYSRWFVDTPYFAPLAWSGASLLVLLLMIALGQGRHPLAWLQVAGLLYSASYLPIGFSCDFRYSYFSVLAASTGLMGLSLQGLHWYRCRRSPRNAQPTTP